MKTIRVVAAVICDSIQEKEDKSMYPIVGLEHLTPEQITLQNWDLNTENTFTELLSRCVIPIVNANDTTSTFEIEFSDNDRLAANVAALLHSDLLILLTDIDALYDSDPKTNPNAKKIDEIKCADIISKGLRVIDLSAASLCNDQKVPVLIFGLNEENSLMRAVKGEKIGTVVTVD